MKSALNSTAVQVIAGVVLLVCAATLTKQCAQEMNGSASHGQIISTAPSVQR